MARYGGAAVTDADRDAAATQLRECYAAGRLSLDEFQDRLDGVYRAQTARELGMVTDSRWQYLEARGQTLAVSLVTALPATLPVESSGSRR